MEGRRRVLSKAKERDAHLAGMERALDRTAHEAAETIDRARTEIERSCGLIDGFAHLLAGARGENEEPGRSN